MYCYNHYPDKEIEILSSPLEALYTHFSHEPVVVRLTTGTLLLKSVSNCKCFPVINFFLNVI